MAKEVLSWADKYQLALKENLNLKDIKALRGCGQPQAIKIRDQAIEYCLANNVNLDSKGRVPAEAVFEVTGKDLSFYYDKMCLEINALKLSEGVKNYVSA